MSESSGSVKQEVPVKVIMKPDSISSGEDPPMSEWSSLVVEVPEENKKKGLYGKGLYSPGSGEVCAKYISMSDSDIFRHIYYHYPAVTDPGIEDALLTPEKAIIYADNGQDLYMSFCAEMNACPVGKFHRGLLSNEIDLSYYGINPSAVRPMAAALQHNKTVHRLNLTDNFLNNDSCYHLSRMLITNCTLKELILAGCRIGASGILRMGSTFAINRSLVLLDISRCCLGDEGGVQFAKYFSEGAGIVMVNLSNNHLGKETALALAEAFEYNNKIVHLDLSWNNFLHIPSLVKMLSELSNSTVLEELNLCWNSLEGERVATQLNQIVLIPTLKILNLSNNRLQDEAITIIIGNLIKAKHLVTLDLSFNPLSTEDAYNVLEKLTRPSVKLENLWLEGVCVDKTFLDLLKKVMQMESRENFKIKYDRVVHNWTCQGPDARKLLLERADYLGMKNKRHQMDVALFFLRIGKDYQKPIPMKKLIAVRDFDDAPWDDDLLNGFAIAFPGPKTAKSKMVNIQLICEYIHRLWPERQLPPTPPPTPPSAPEPEPLPPPPTKGKKGKPK